MMVRTIKSKICRCSVAPVKLKDQGPAGRSPGQLRWKYRLWHNNSTSYIGHVQWTDPGSRVNYRWAEDLKSLHQAVNHNRGCVMLHLPVFNIYFSCDKFPLSLRLPIFENGQLLAASK